MRVGMFNGFVFYHYPAGLEEFDYHGVCFMHILARKIADLGGKLPLVINRIDQADFITAA